MTQGYYAGSHAAAIVYDVSNRESFDKVAFWMSEIQNAKTSSLQCQILIGNKCDLPERDVTAEEGEELAKQYDVPFMETSAKDSTNVEEMFTAMLEKLISSVKLSTAMEPAKVDLAQAVSIEGSKECC